MAIVCTDCGCICDRHPNAKLCWHCLRQRKLLRDRKPRKRSAEYHTRKSRRYRAKRRHVAA